MHSTTRPAACDAAATIPTGGGSAVPGGDTAVPGEVPHARQAGVADREGAELDRLLALRARVDATIAESIQLLISVLAQATIETIARLDPEMWLATEAGMTRADRRSLLRAAEVLRSMPATLRRFEAGGLSWSQVRPIVFEVASCTRDEQATVDALVEDLCATHPTSDPDDVVDAVRRMVAELRADTTRQRERRAVRGEYLAIQPWLDGSGGDFHGSMDAPGLASLLEAVDDAADVPGRADAEADATVDGHERRHACRGLGAARIAGLKRLCGHWLATGPGTDAGRRPKPLMHVHVDAARIARGVAGELEWRLPGATPTITRRALDALAADADIVAILTHHGLPVASTSPLRAGRTPRPLQATGDTITAVRSPGPGTGAAAARATGERPAGRRATVTASEALAGYDLDAIAEAVTARLDTTDDIPARRRAQAVARDGRCRFPACRAPAAWTDIHHLRHRVDGGDHRLSNLLSLCRRHHTATHHSWQVRLRDDGVAVWTSPTGRTYQPAQTPAMPSDLGAGATLTVPVQAPRHGSHGRRGRSHRWRWAARPNSRARPDPPTHDGSGAFARSTADPELLPHTLTAS